MSSLEDDVQETGLYRVSYENAVRWELWDVEKDTRTLVGYALNQRLAHELWEEFVMIRDMNTQSVNDFSDVVKIQ